MTVARVTRMDLAAGKALVVERALDVLKANPEYHRTQIDSARSVITTTLQTHPLLLPTKTTISLVGDENSTSVSVLMESPVFIIGDAFGLFDTYARRFCERLAIALDSPNQAHYFSSMADKDNGIRLQLAFIFTVLIVALALLSISGAVHLGGSLKVWLWLIVGLLAFAWFGVYQARRTRN